MLIKIAIKLLKIGIITCTTIALNNFFQAWYNQLQHNTHDVSTQYNLGFAIASELHWALILAMLPTSTSKLMPGVSQHNKSSEFGILQPST